MNKVNKKIVKMYYIKHEYLYNIDISDSFFDSLKLEYKEFEKWYNQKMHENAKAYITRYKNGNLASFMMCKMEYENEDYTCFKDVFDKNVRLKIQTFKVSNSGFKIGDEYMKIIFETAKKNNADEIYVTVFDNHKKLISFFKKYGFIKRTIKNNERSNSETGEELVLVKSVNKHFKEK